MLKLYYCDDDWKCDGANFKRKCFSGITDFDNLMALLDTVVLNVIMIYIRNAQFTI